ncbi:histidine phosphatase family protein [Paenibacillus pini]|uniref:Phosphoglycerate mutase n=1 Tax=Paenibacillus pini JCM 16418 TaxID=1236976 RepID=W7Y6R8_9BACL|nr:histidine phosphatase family protein [Paenibacillus pini]GAF06605.1 hypothetical protein JCM16418_573 [Paenibacillus pini JCM 16418]
MIIGLVRHFKVTYKPISTWMNSEEFNQWIEEYNKSGVSPPESTGHGVEWNMCLSSDLSRATVTAEMLHKGQIIKTDQLREIAMRSVTSTQIKLHYYMWLFIIRIAWLVSHKSQDETKAETILRAKQVVDQIEENDKGSNILVVSHGAFMRVLYQELIRRGYKGRGFAKPKNGKLYTFEKK